MYRVEIGGLEVSCDTADELKGLVGRSKAGKVATKRTSAGRRNTGVGAKKSWAAARKLSKEKGITVTEARAQIAKTKKK